MRVNTKHYFEYRKLLKRRFLEIGFDGFMDQEALELLLSYSVPRYDIRHLADGLMGAFGEFQSILDASVEELVAFPGMDVHTAILLKATRDCTDLYLKRRVMKKHVIRGWPELIKYCKLGMSDLKDEQFRVVFLNINMEVTEIETIHEGTIDQAVVYPRKVMERALYHKAAALVFVHNHPNGNAQPSLSDKEMTYKLIAAANSLDIEVHDHLIICRDSFFSFRDAGMMVEVPEKLLKISLKK